MHFIISKNAELLKTDYMFEIVNIFSNHMVNIKEESHIAPSCFKVTELIYT